MVPKIIASPSVAVPARPRALVPALAVGLVMVVATGCVTTGTYNQKVAELAAHDKKNAQTIQSLEAQIKDRDTRIAALNAEREAVRKQLDETTALAGELKARLEKLGQNVDKLVSEKGQLARVLADANARLEELRRQKQAAEARAAMFRNLVAQLRSMIDAGQLKVVIRDGRMLIALPNDVLFDSGKTDIKPDGQAALVQVAEVLATIPDRHFLVAGHTDDVPIHTARLPSNWELSTARAVEVTKFLVANGMRPRGAGRRGLRRVRSGRRQRHARAPRPEPAHRDRAGAEPLGFAVARRHQDDAIAPRRYQPGTAGADMSRSGGARPAAPRPHRAAGGGLARGARDARQGGVRSAPVLGRLITSLALLAAAAGRASAQDDATPSGVVEQQATAPAAPSQARPAARLKLSLEGFTIRTSWGMPVGLTGLHLEGYPLSRKWLRGGVGLTGGMGSATFDGASADAVYGLLGASIGTQYPGRVTPFVEAHLAGGFMTASLDRPLTVGGVTVDSASGTTWLVVGGLDAGAELYVFRRAYLSLSLGWMRSTWASPDFDPNAPTAPSTFRITTVTADSLLWKVGLGI